MSIEFDKDTFEESGGFNKWSLGVDTEDACVVVRLGHYPNHAEMRLHDIVGDDLERVAAMFANAAEYFSAKHKISEVEQKARL